MRIEEKVTVLKDYYRRLLEIGAVRNQNELAELLGMNRSTVSSAMNGSEKALTDRFLKKVCDLVTEAEQPKPRGIFIPAETAEMYKDLVATVRSQQETIAILAGSVTQRPFTKKEGAHVVGAEK